MPIVVRTISAPPVVQNPQTPVTPKQEVTAGIFMTGADGSVWDLVNGPAKALEDLDWGYSEPEVWRSTSALLAGSQLQGERDPEGFPHVPVRLEADDALSFRDLDAAFARALRGGDVVFTVVTPDGLSRSLTTRYEAGLKASQPFDPMLVGYASYPLDFIALDPYWHPSPVVAVYSIVNQANMLPSSEASLAAAILTINVAHSQADAVITNPGDVDAWPTWTITGPYTTATVGVGSSVVELGTPIAAGQSRIISTGPVPDIVDGSGADKWLDATDASFTPIPAGTDVELSIDVVGGTDNVTTISLAFTPAYRRQW